MKYAKIPITGDDRNLCVKHARKMCAGAKTRNFKHGTLQGEDVYEIGKIGEFAAGTWLKRLGVKITHSPFRSKYDYFDPNDDFIIEIDGKPHQLEIRTKARNVDPRPDFECCSDCIKPHLTYLFVSYNRKTSDAWIVGFANETLMRQKTRAVLRGQENNNFQHKANEYNILIADLIEPKWFELALCIEPPPSRLLTTELSMQHCQKN